MVMVVTPVAVTMAPAPPGREAAMAAFQATLSVSTTEADPGEGAKDSTPYLKCVLDDPSFSAPVQAALFDHANGADLVWSRRSEP